MKLLHRGLLILLAPLLLTSTACTKRQLVKQEIEQQVVCSSTAFINEVDYELPIPPKDDLGFRQWQASAILKYPELKNAYSILRECWDFYHPAGDRRAD